MTSFTQPEITIPLHGLQALRDLNHANFRSLALLQRLLEEQMRATSWKVLGCTTLLTLNMGLMQGMAQADDTDTGATPDDTFVGDPVVDDTIGSEPSVGEPEVTIADDETTYDPVIAQSGVAETVPNQRGNSNNLDGAMPTFNRSGDNGHQWKVKGPKPSLFGTNSPLRNWFKELAAK
jgi:hypothetical protein